MIRVTLLLAVTLCTLSAALQFSDGEVAPFPPNSPSSLDIPIREALLAKTASKEQVAWESGFRIEPLGFRLKFSTDEKARHLEVAAIDESSPLAGGLERRDLLIFPELVKEELRNDQLLFEFCNQVFQGLQDGKLEVRYKRSGKIKVHTKVIDLPKDPSIGESFLKTNPLRTQMIHDTLSFIKERQKDEGLWQPETWPIGWRVSVSSTCGLALLSDGYQEHKVALDKAAAAIAERMKVESLQHRKNLRNSPETWALALGGLFLCEYSMASGTDAHRDQIEYAIGKLRKAQSKNGYWMHGFKGPNVTGYTELTSVSSMVLLFLATAKHKGHRVPSHEFKLGLERLAAITHEGSIGYSMTRRERSADKRSKLGTTALAASIAKLSDSDLKYADNWKRHVKKRWKDDWFRGHPAPAIHQWWLTSWFCLNREAATKSEKAAFEEYYQYFGAYARMSQLENGSFCAQPNEESIKTLVGTGWGNYDAAYGPELATAWIALGLTAPESKLWHFGGAHEASGEEKSE